VIQFMRYIDDVTINAAAQRLVNCMAPNPFARRGDNSDKTIKAIRENLHRAFGDFARSIKIPVH
jgi:hypothetical protein